MQSQKGPMKARATLALYEAVSGEFVVVYENPETNAYEEAWFATKAEAEEFFAPIHQLLASASSGYLYESDKDGELLPASGGQA